MESIIERLVRDSKKVTILKKMYENCCQICGDSITLLKEIRYSEVHHIQPFNRTHKGIDDIPNMLVLCPNHHQLFDLGILALNPEDHKTLLHLDPKNPLHNKELNLSFHKLSSTCVRYHYEKVFLKLKKELTTTTKKVSK